MMNIKPILFSTPMVQAILEGRKSQTRRLIKESFNGCFTNGGPHPCPNEPVFIHKGEVLEHPFNEGEQMYVDRTQAHFHCSTLDSVAFPKCEVGDIFWVRETLHQEGELYLSYSADGEHIDEDVIKIPSEFVRLDKYDHYKFCDIPNIFMPKWACRIFLQVTGVKVERLMDISEADAVAEGIESIIDFEDGTKGYKNYAHDMLPCPAVHSYYTLWEKLNGEGSYEANPWVWVYYLKRVEKPKEFLS